jgi:hypothetical protein
MMAITNHFRKDNSEVLRKNNSNVSGNTSMTKVRDSDLSKKGK